MPKSNSGYFDDQYELRNFQVIGRFPLYTKKFTTESGFRMRRLLCNSNFGYNSTGKINLVNNYSAGLGFRYLSYRNEKNAWLISGNGLALFYSQSNPTRFIPTARLLYMRKTSPTFSYFVGMGYNFLFGGGFPMPLLGFHWKPSQNAALTMVLPGFARFSLRHSQWWSSQLLFQPTNNLGLAPATDIPEETNNVIVRSRAVKCGYQARIGNKNGLRWIVESGLLFRRKLQFSDQINGFNTSASNSPTFKIKNSWYLELTLTIPLKKKSTIAPEDEVNENGLEEDDFGNGIW